MNAEHKALKACCDYAPDTAIHQINELVARLIVAQTIEVRMQLGKELKAAFAAYLRDVTVTTTHEESSVIASTSMRVA